MDTLTLLIFLASLAIYGFVGYRYWAKNASVAVASDMPQAGVEDDYGPERPNLPPWLNTLADLGRKAATEDKDGAALRRKLDRAGFRQSWAPQIFHGASMAVLVGLPLLTFVLIGLIAGSPLSALPPTAFAVYLGLIGPERYLKFRARRRAVAMRLALPDFLDLLVVSVESGLSLDQAVADTARDLQRARPELSEELAVFGREVQAGATRADALRNLGARTGDPEMRKLASILIQADRFGSSVSKVLRNQARYMRIKRRQAAEEAAHKVGVKMIFPIFLLIMPSVFLVTAGPAVIMLMENFKRMVADI